MAGLPPKIESLDEAWTFIEALDLSNARNKLSHPRWGKPLPDKVIDHAERDYRRFLFLMRKYPGLPFSPTLDIDLVWHEHVLDTIPYFRETAAIFGHYLHHLPSKPDDGEDGPPLAEGTQNTYRLYAEEFGDVLQTYFRGKEGGDH
jgi:hypothetical protein